MAESWAADNARCVICGVTQAFIRRLGVEGRYPPGGPRHWQRLTIDHVAPEGPRDDPANMRLLCYQCQHRRGRGRFTDEEVARWSRERWRRFYPEHLLWLWEEFDG